MSTIKQLFFNEKRNTDENGLYNSLEVPYALYGYTDAATAESALRAYLTANSKTQIRNARFSEIELTEQITDNDFFFKAIYDCSSSSESSDSTPESTFSFSTSGATRHIDRSILTRRIYYKNSSGQTQNYAPSDGGPINVDDAGKVNGLDINMPQYVFSETHYFKPSKVTTSFKLKLKNCTGKTNAGAFRGHNAGEVLFMGADGSRNGDGRDDYWQITYKFAAGENNEKATIGGITVEKQFAWDYVWVKWTDDVDETTGSIVKVPDQILIEQVYNSANFAQ